MQDGETKYLVMTATCENDSLVLVVECPYEYVVQLWERIRWAEAGRATDTDLASISFFDGVEAYEISHSAEDEFDKWLDGDEDRRSQWDEVQWVCSDEKPAFSEDSHVRVDSSYLKVSAFSWVSWLMTPKHGDTEYGTTGLSEDSLEKAGLTP